MNKKFKIKIYYGLVDALVKLINLEMFNQSRDTLWLIITLDKINIELQRNKITIADLRNNKS